MMAATQRSENEEAVGGEGDLALRRMEELVRETAVGDTMYEKRWVLRWIEVVGSGINGGKALWRLQDIFQNPT